MNRWISASVFFLLILTSVFVGIFHEPVWTIEKTELPVKVSPSGDLVYEFNKTIRSVEESLPPNDSHLWPLIKTGTTQKPIVPEETIAIVIDDKYVVYFLRAVQHWGIWSLLPPITAVVLCFLLREPLLALTSGVLSGAFIMQKYDISDQILIPTIGSETGGTVVLLYLIFLGGLLGLWSRNGGAYAFGQWATKSFVRSPVGAKLTAWVLGVAFFQGGSISSILVGTTVRPVADRQRVSHEELSYVVDSTSAPIAILFPFNTWPIYVQSFIFVLGIPFLATEGDRIRFFFNCIPLYFYAILSVFFTLLLCFDKLPFMNRAFRDAIRRARETGQLDRPGSEPLISNELEKTKVPPHYNPHPIEFIIPVVLIIGTAVITFILEKSPSVLSGFGIALLASIAISLLRGLTLSDLTEGFLDGLKASVYGAVVLLVAIAVGQTTNGIGAGPFLVEQLKESIPFQLLPIALMITTMAISFSTGTSWGTFAVALPLAMPLTVAIAQNANLNNPLLYISICFATVINGSIYGDQCSPISDTTVLSAISTSADLMDHVRTQIYPSTMAAIISMALWTILTFVA